MCKDWIRFNIIYAIQLSAVARHQYEIYVAKEDCFHTEITFMWIFLKKARGRRNKYIKHTGEAYENDLVTYENHDWKPEMVL